MSTIKKVYNLIILDESGSMSSIQQATMSTFNELIQSIAAETTKIDGHEQWINFFSFNGVGIKEQMPLQKVSSLLLLHEENYRPDSLTPLFDAIGHATGKLKFALEKEKDYAVLVTILTDGEENASKEYTGEKISALINELKKKNWVFTYIGTNQDVAKEAAKINITNHLYFAAPEMASKSVLSKELKARERFYRKLEENPAAAVQDNYFDAEQ
ncbi:VWA domain-containing protein [Flavihumibacter fluvii]|uniref:VWA domain-containing protein n=1 Tax=Flavihumibacter fluvii TaxID=2838157 RepID=UPI001BDDEA96|nr:VWA domain-containing protein [Flavihumibacter fluvii]ULQ51921.1 VWA domain-containing protein [Flavihumibacter fluvii]